MQLNLFLILAILVIAVLLACFAIGLITRRWVLRRKERLYNKKVHAIRSTLLGALANHEDNFVVDCWNNDDHEAALEVSSQLLGLINGPGRDRLVKIVEANGILQKPLMLIDRQRRHKRLAAVKKLSPFTVSPVLEKLEELVMNDPWEKIRLEAANILARSGNLNLTNEILKALCPEGQLTPAHKSVFSTMLPEHEKEVVSIAVNRPEASLRIMALAALAKNGRKAVARQIGGLINDDDPQIRMETLNTLAKIGSKQATKWVRKGLVDDDLRVRSAAAMASGEIGCAQAVPDLQILANDNDRGIRELAGRAIVKITNGQMSPHIRNKK